MAGKSDFLENALLNAVLRGVTYTSPSTVYLALFTVTPTDVAASGTEVSASGTAYSRQVCAFGAPTGTTQVANSADITFSVATASWGTIVAYAIMDASTGGNVLYYAAVSPNKAIGLLDQAKVTAGSIVISED